MAPSMPAFVIDVHLKLTEQYKPSERHDFIMNVLLKRILVYAMLYMIVYG